MSCVGRESWWLVSQRSNSTGFAHLLLALVATFSSFSFAAFCLAQERAQEAVAGSGNSDETDPDGFRGIRWGQAVDSVPGMKPTGGKLSNDFVWYEREGDQMQVGDAKLFKLNYLAYKGKLFRVDLTAIGNNEDRLSAVIVAKYGEGTRVFDPRKLGAVWPRDLNGPKTGASQYGIRSGNTFIARIEGYNNGFGRTTSVSLVSVGIAEQLNRESEESAKARPGDF
jgi:hypothetical protein